jgi:hypothetical protein
MECAFFSSEKNIFIPCGRQSELPIQIGYSLTFSASDRCGIAPRGRWVDEDRSVKWRRQLLRFIKPTKKSLTRPCHLSVDWQVRQETCEIVVRTQEKCMWSNDGHALHELGR